MDQRRGSVLLVEDDPNDVALTQRAFERAGFANPLQVLSDGEQAIGYLGGEASYADRNRYPLPILVLLDLKLPRTSGFEVLAWIRGAPNIRRLPVVVLTSSQQSPDIDRAYDAGNPRPLLVHDEPGAGHRRERTTPSITDVPSVSSTTPPLT